MLIAGNWKMNGLLADGLDFVKAIPDVSAHQAVEVALMPPFTLLHVLQQGLADKGVNLGAQNTYYETCGAFTGSICPVMLKDAGCQYVLLGHSERRSIMGEANQAILHKMQACWDNGLEPLLCIGESLQQRQQGVTNAILAEQLSVLKDVAADRPLTVAYEPVWAIGTGQTASAEQVVETHAFVHQELQRLGNDCRVLYGGSVNPANALELLSCPGVEGALVGGASLKAESFAKIISAGVEASSKDV